MYETTLDLIDKILFTEQTVLIQEIGGELEHHLYVVEMPL